MCKDQLLSKGGTVSFDEICRSPEICQNLWTIPMEEFID